MSQLKAREQRLLEENAKLENLYNQVQDQISREEDGAGQESVKLLRQANHKLELQVVELMNSNQVGFSPPLVCDWPHDR